MTRPRLPNALRATCGLAVTLAILVATPHRAVAAAEDAPAPAETETSWYGWQTALADVGAIGLWSLAVWVDDAGYANRSQQAYETGSRALAVAGVLAYGFGGPAIHWSRGHADTAKTSLLLRLGLPVGGMLAGLVLAGATCGQSESEVPCPLVAGALGFMAGGAAAMIVDAALLARERVPAHRPPRFQTALIPTGGGAALLVGGRF